MDRKGGDTQAESGHLKWAGVLGTPHTTFKFMATVAWSWRGFALDSRDAEKSNPGLSFRGRVWEARFFTYLHSCLPSPYVLSWLRQCYTQFGFFHNRHVTRNLCRLVFQFLASFRNSTTCDCIRTSLVMLWLAHLSGFNPSMR